MKTLNLQKGQALVLTKDNGESLSNVTLGLGWTSVRTITETKKVGGFFGFGGKTETITRQVPGRAIDLDASCIVLDGNKQVIDIVSFRKLSSKGIKHLGDDRTGNDKKSATDNEQIKVDLSAVDSRAKHLIFTVNSFTGESFKDVNEAYCRLLDSTTNEEKVRVTLAEKGNYTAAILCSVSKNSSGKWEIKNLSGTGNASVADRLVTLAQSLI